MKKILIFLVLVILVIAIGVYYKLNSSGIELSFTESDIEAQLSKRMPVQKNYLLIFDVELDHPKVTLVDGAKRIQIDLDLGLSINLGRDQNELAGKIVFSSQLRYDPNQSALYLSQPEIEQIDLPGVPQSYLDNAESVVNAAMTAYFETHAIFTLDQTSFKQIASRMIIKDVLINQKELIVKLGL